MSSRPSLSVDFNFNSSNSFRSMNSSAVSLSDSDVFLPSLSSTSTTSSASQSSLEPSKIVSSSDLFRRLSFLYDLSTLQESDLLKLKEDAGPRDLRDLRRLRAAVEALSTAFDQPIEKSSSKKDVMGSSSKGTENGLKGDRKVKRKPAPKFVKEDLGSFQVMTSIPRKSISRSDLGDGQTIRIQPTFDMSSLTNAGGNYKLQVDLPLEQNGVKLTSLGINGLGHHQKSPDRPPRRNGSSNQASPSGKSGSKAKTEVSPPRENPSIKSEAQVKDGQESETVAPSKKNRMSMMFTRSKGVKNKSKGKASVPVPSLPIPSTLVKNGEKVSMEVESNVGEVKVVTPSTARPTIFETLSRTSTDEMTPRLATFVSVLDHWSTSMEDQQFDQELPTLVKPKRKPVPDLPSELKDEIPISIQINCKSSSTSPPSPPTRSPRTKRRPSKSRDSIIVASSPKARTTHGSTTSLTRSRSKSLAEKSVVKDLGSLLGSQEIGKGRDGDVDDDERLVNGDAQGGLLSIPRFNSKDQSGSGNESEGEISGHNSSSDEENESESGNESSTQDSDVSHETQTSSQSSLFDSRHFLQDQKPIFGRHGSSDSIATTASFRSVRSAPETK